MTTAQWRTLTLVLAVIFLAVVALLVVILLGRIGDDGGTGSTSTPTPTATASASPSPTGPASASPEASASIEPSPSASASPATGGVPPARAVIRDLGIDVPGDPQARPRIFVFRSDGGGDVTVRLLSVSSGRARFCLYPGTLAAPLGEPACLRTTGSTLTGHSKGKKPFTWTVTLIGTKAGVKPMADLRIDWPATDPSLEIVDFRLQGQGAEPYNGVFVQLAGRPEAGQVTLAASWSDPVGGDSHPYKATIEDRDTRAILDSAEGDGTNVALGANLVAKQRTMVELRNPGPMVATEVLATLTLTWP